MEEIKSKYYREMKKFIGIPNIFRGVGGDAAAADLIFPAMIDRNASGFHTCYYKASELFKRLDSVQNIFKVRMFIWLMCIVWFFALWKWFIRFPIILLLIYIFILPSGSTSKQQKKREENRQSMSSIRLSLTNNE